MDDYRKKMKQYRFEHDLSQTQMAEKLEMSQQLYSAYERGYLAPQFDFLLKYRQCTGVDLTVGTDLSADATSNASADLTMKKLVKEYNTVLATVKKLQDTVRKMEKEIAALKKQIVQLKSR